MERLAVIGGGLSGLTCAYRLQKEFDVTLFEKANVLGGHVRTYVTPKGNVVNPNVLMFVKGLYNNFFALMNEIGFDRFKSLPIYYIIHVNGKIVHADLALDPDVFARNLPTYLDPRSAPSFAHTARFVRFLLKFRRDFKKRRFPDDLLVEDLVPYYPEYEELIRFWAWPFAFVKTQVTLSVNDLAALLFGAPGSKSAFRLAYMTKGGVYEYIERLASRTKADIRLSSPIKKLKKCDRGFEITTPDGGKHRFDRVIIATQPRDVRHFLEYWDDEQPALFDDIDRYYEPTMVVIHKDPSIYCGIPRRLWGKGGINFDPKSKGNTVTLNVARITGADEDVFVTYMNDFDLDFSKAPDWAAMDWRSLPEGSRVDPRSVLDARVLMHPLWGNPGQKKRFKEIHDYSGRDHLYFSGVGLDGKNTIGQEGAVTAALSVVEQLRRQPATMRKPSAFEEVA